MLLYLFDTRRLVHRILDTKKVFAINLKIMLLTKKHTRGVFFGDYTDIHTRCKAGNPARRNGQGLDTETYIP